MNKEEIIKKLNDENTSIKEAIQLRGQLITILKKEISEVKDQRMAIPLKAQLHEELKKHKKCLKSRTQEGDIKLPERVGLKVKEIANAIEIFKEKHDIVGKIKNTAITTTISSLIAGAVTVGISLVGGAPLTLATLAAAIPTLAYCGVSGVLRMPFTETTWTKLVKSIDSKDQNQKQIMDFINDNVKDNKELMTLLDSKTKKPSEQELIVINNKLIGEYSKLIAKAPIPELAKTLTFEKINLLTEQKKIYEKIKNEYVKSKRELTPGQFANLEKDIIGINLQLTKENAYIKDVLKQSGKDLAVSAGTLAAASAIVSKIIPQAGPFSVANLTIPLIFTFIGNLANMGTLKEKIRLEKEQYDKAKTTLSKAQIEKLLPQNNVALKAA